jgi:hypothetical protein
MEILELKNTIIEIKNINSGFELIEERINKLEDKFIKHAI